MEVFNLQLVDLDNLSGIQTNERKSKDGKTAETTLARRGEQEGRREKGLL